MHKILMVIRREYLDRVKKKSFWIGTLVFPLIMVVLVMSPMLMMFLNPEEQRKIVVVDATEKLVEPLKQGLVDNTLKNGQPSFMIESAPLKGTLEETEKTLEPRIRSGEIFGIMTIGNDLDEKMNFRLYAKNVGNIEVASTLEHALRKAVVGLRLERMQLNIDRASLDRATAPLDLESFQVQKSGETKKKNFLGAYFGTFIFVFILFMSMLLYGIAVMRGILEEKSNRVMEVLLGSLSPDQLMTGKILGIGLVGLTQMLVYLCTAGALRLYFAMSRMGADWTSTKDTVMDALSPTKMIYMVVFFILGYFMYTALFASVGAACNSEQEAQNLQAPVQYTLMIPMITTMFFVNNPDSTIAVVASMIPIFTPMVMFMRISLLTPPFWQIALSIILMLGTIYLFFRGAAKVFRIGVLMYGKRPTIPELLRWARS